jgi:tRNA-dihydrouridine synthase
MNRQQGLRLIAETGVDGIMIGRGVLRNIQAFAERPQALSPERRLELFRQHLDLYESVWQGSKPFDPMKKFAKLYISEFSGAAELRAHIMETSTADQARETLKNH